VIEGLYHGNRLNGQEGRTSYSPLWRSTPLINQQPTCIPLSST